MKKLYLVSSFMWNRFGRISLQHYRNKSCNSFCTYSAVEALEIPSDREEPTLETFHELLTSSDRKAQVQSIIHEIHEARKVGKRVPTTVNVAHMKELLLSESRHQRIAYLSYLSKKEKKQISSLRKQEQKRMEKVISPVDVSEEDKPVRGLFKTTFLRHIQRPSIRRIQNLRLAYASLFEQKLVIDLDYDDFMLRREIKNCIKQLHIVFSSNKNSKNPFDLYVCNVKPMSYSMECLKNDIPRFGQDDCLDTFTESSYTDLFPKEKLVYLSPHAKETMTEYDPSVVYIIGAFVDLSTQWKISHEKAEHDGIRSLSLPLDDYFKWRGGSKCLSINQVYEILLEMKHTGDWKKALRVVPPRKYQKPSSEPEAAERKLESSES